MEAKLDKNKIKKSLKITFNVFFYALILLILLFSIANMRVKTTKDIPNIFGKGFLSVQSNSMEGTQKDSFKKGDLIFVRMLNDKRREKLEVGDIITFYGFFYNETTGKSENYLNTHRIVKIINNEGNIVLITQGDRVAETPGRKYGEGGENDDRNYESINLSEAIAVYTGKWNKFGTTMDYLQSPTGFGLFIVLPTVLILAIEAYFLISNVLKLNREKMEKEFKLKDEELRKQIMEELKKEQESQNK